MNVKIMAGDQTVSNLSGGHWKDSTQVAARSCRLYKASYSNITAADYFAWFFNVAAGSGASAAPVQVRPIPPGTADTWDFGDGGKLFTLGCYIVFATGLPTDPTSTPAVVGDDQVIFDADIRVG
jgi:hypothetical protein